MPWQEGCPDTPKIAHYVREKEREKRRDNGKEGEYTRASSCFGKSRVAGTASSWWNLYPFPLVYRPSIWTDLTIHSISDVGDAARLPSRSIAHGHPLPVPGCQGHAVAGPACPLWYPVSANISTPTPTMPFRTLLALADMRIYSYPSNHLQECTYGRLWRTRYSCCTAVTTP